MKIHARTLVTLSALFALNNAPGLPGVKVAKGERAPVSERARAKPTGNRTTKLKQDVSKGRQYKRVHQYALDQILSGHAAQAVTFLRRHAAANPRDAETQFMLGLALVQRGKKAEATAAMRKALSLGLPSGRLMVGPRDLLGPLCEPDALRDVLGTKPDSPWQPVHGPMVGNVTDRSADLWIRTARPGMYRAVVREIESPGDKPGRVVSEAEAKATPQSDYTAVIRVKGLRPDRLYCYSVVPKGTRPIPMSDTQHLRTAPAPGSGTRFTLAFGGGAGYVPPHERMWHTIDANKPNLLLLLGDNIYSDHPESPHMQRYCYYRRQSRPEFRALIAHTPVYAIWDEHDFGTNDCWGGSEIDHPTWKRPVWNVFRQNWVNPGYGGGEARPGCWYAFNWGDVAFFMLDCRYYRTDPRIQDPSMLGPVQKKWLEKKLRASKATFKVICSSVPFDFRTKGDSLDTWNGYRDEREEIFRFLETEKIDGVILMSADRHRSDLWKIERDRGYALYEFNSSRLTNQHVHKAMPAAVFSYNKKQSFGLVEFDTLAPDPTVKYAIVTIDGETVHAFTVKRSRLTHESKRRS